MPHHLPPVLMYSELKKAFDTGADRYWLLNVGDIKPMELAMKKMNGRNASGFLVWCYLSLNADGFELALSNKDALERAGIKKDSYDSGVSLLIDNGYLVQKEGNTYDFYQFPNGVEPPEDEKEKKG